MVVTIATEMHVRMNVQTSGGSRDRHKIELALVDGELGRADVNVDRTPTWV